ncbi:MAG: GNAT family N-acetyltransferase [Alicyclobacillaceae bacterium]|nr:GNAT family N-acetyltransferase [Alicyclobacillaceae bacterium]
MTRVILRDGRAAEFRVAENTDRDREIIRALFRSASPESLYFRFFHVVREVSEDVIDRMVRADGIRDVTLLCMAGEEALGIGTYNWVDEERAEVAFLVNDRVHGRGIGTLLLEHLADIAWKNGYKYFEAYVLRENEKMLNVFLSSGYEIRSEQQSGTVHLVLKLAQTERTRALQETREKLAVAASLAPFFHPRTVAVVGASRDPVGLGHILFRHIVEAGFQGVAYPVNPSARSVAGVRAYPSIREIPEPVDLAVVAVPASQVPRVIEDCAGAGVRSVIVISSGLSGAEGEDAQNRAEIARRLRSAGARLLGPNSLGLINTSPSVRLNASFVPRFPLRGKLAVASHSGALGIAILEYASRMGIGISSFASMGHKGDISGNDLLQYWEDDHETEIIALYLESFGNPRKFSRIARRITQHKPIVAVKGARTERGASVSPTGSAVPPARDFLVEALFRQTGIIRVNTLQELFDVTALLGFSPLPEGNRVAIVTNTAGGAVMAVDALQNEGLRLAGAPTDLGTVALAEGYRKVLPEVLRDPEVDAVLVLFTPVGFSDDREVAQAVAEAVREAAQGEGPSGAKPVVANFLMTEDNFVRFIEAGDRRIPVYPFPEQAVRALAKVVEYAHYRRNPRGRIPDLPDADPDAARRVIRRHCPDAAGRAEGTEWLPAGVCEEVLRAMGIRTSGAAGESPGEVVRLTVTAELDPLFGMILLVERPPAASAVRITPLTDLDSREVLERVAGGAATGCGAAADLLLRVSRLVEEVYEITKLVLKDVEVSGSGVAIGECRIAVGRRGV